MTNEYEIIERENKIRRDNSGRSLSRRNVLRSGIAAVAAAGMLGKYGGGSASAQTPPPASKWWTTPVIIESHLNGFRDTSYNINTPVTNARISADAIECWEAGAYAIHFHPASMFLYSSGQQAANAYMDAINQALIRYPNMSWYSSTTTATVNGAGVVTASGIEHVVILAQQGRVKFCPIDPGSANLAMDVNAQGVVTGTTYTVPLPAIPAQIDLCIANNMEIIWGIYEPGYLRTALYYMSKGRTTPVSHFDFYLQGDYGTLCKQPANTCGLPPTIESLNIYLKMVEDAGYSHLPWFISIWGEGGLDTRPLIKYAIERGGHIKTGLELHFDPDRKPTNVELLREVQDIASEVGRPLAAHDVVIASGDVNGDGNVNMLDATILTRGLAGWAGVGMVKDAADVDVDGTVTVRDLSTLRRHLGGWKGYETLPRR